MGSHEVAVMPTVQDPALLTVPATRVVNTALQDTRHHCYRMCQRSRHNGSTANLNIGSRSYGQGNTAQDVTMWKAADMIQCFYRQKSVTEQSDPCDKR